MRLSIRHELRFSIGEVSHAVQHLLLTPADTPAQKIIEWSIKAPGMETAARFIDAFGNIAHLINQTRPEDDVFIAVSGIVETHDTNGVLGRLPGDPNVALFRRITPNTKPNGNLVNRLRAQAKAGMGRVELLHWLMNRLHEARENNPEDADDTPEIIAEDHAHVFVAAARGIDVPARFVTGYVHGEPGRPARLHCWAEAFDDALGWIGFDPLADLCPTEAYVRLAAGLDAETTVPVRRAPDLAPAGAEIIAVAQISDQQQQQQQGSGAQKQ